jgi:hypothetical protein
MYNRLSQKVVFGLLSAVLMAQPALADTTPTTPTPSGQIPVAPPNADVPFGDKALKIQGNLLYFILIILVVLIAFGILHAVQGARGHRESGWKGGLVQALAGLAGIWAILNINTLWTTFNAWWG